MNIDDDTCVFGAGVTRVPLELIALNVSKVPLDLVQKAIQGVLVRLKRSGNNDVELGPSALQHCAYF